MIEQHIYNVRTAVLVNGLHKKWCDVCLALGVYIRYLVLPLVTCKTVSSCDNLAIALGKLFCIN